MPFDSGTINALAGMVLRCRDLLRKDVQEQFQSQFGLQPDGSAIPISNLSHLDPPGMEAASRLRQWQEHIIPGLLDVPLKDRKQAAFALMTRESAFTILNRLAALRLCEEREFIVECLRKGMNSDGFLVFERLAGTTLGTRHETYRHFLEAVFWELAQDLGVLFDNARPESIVFPSQTCLETLLAELDSTALAGIWKEDETFGWMFQYAATKEERKQLRKESAAPRNSFEMAVLNQFFTPRYVVEFLTDNTLGRLFLEMRPCTRLAERCSLLLRQVSHPAREGVTARDPRDIRLLDPACGSGHFLLYSFDLFESWYEESWDQGDTEAFTGTGNTLREDFPDRDAFLRAVPELILRFNLFGCDIDARACQVAALALWLRAQRSFSGLGLAAGERPRIEKVNVICAEPMPGDPNQLEAFTSSLTPAALGQLVKVIFEKMRLAGEAGPLLRMEREIQGAIETARSQVRFAPTVQQDLIPEIRKVEPVQTELIFDVKGVKEDFWQTAEGAILAQLAAYAENATDDEAVRGRLFAGDAASGLGFIDLCRRRYSVILMNPPFGAASKGSKEYIGKTYPRTKNDVYAVFIERGLELLETGGLLGAITSRTGFFLSSFKKWREEILMREAELMVMADLGSGVLDAMVETAAYVLRKK